MAECETSQNSINEFMRVHVKDEIKAGKFSSFSPFDPEQKQEAYDLTAEFMEVANANRDNDPINKVLEKAREADKTYDSGLVRWSLSTFITHHPAARSRKLKIPSLVRRAPELCASKKKDKKPKKPLTREVTSVLGSEEELKMNWYREDPNLQEHHEHWHLVYQGIPNSDDPKIREKAVIKDRHGEMFIYMHRQMLARYDTERLGLNLGKTKPLDDYDAPIPEGYNPDDQLMDGDEVIGAYYSTRNPGLKIDERRKKRMKGSLEKIKKAISNGVFDDEAKTKVTIDLLGAILEPNDAVGSNLGELYGGLHGAGHVALGNIKSENKEGPGVLGDPTVAAHDPVFWRWHRHIDDLAYEWQKTLPYNKFTDSSPGIKGIKIRDIILSFKDKLGISLDESTKEKAEQVFREATAFGEQKFGDFDKDVSDNEVTNILETTMRKRPIKDGKGAKQEIEYLFPREFYYYFRVENTSSSKVDGTFRVFLVPDESVNEPRQWIEMDKFMYSLSPKSKAVICRDCDMSSVVRQPPQKTAEELDEVIKVAGREKLQEWQINAGWSKSEEDDESFCDCGLPFSLLLPRGTREGLKCKLFLLITDWAKDQIPSISRCGSVSFCGAEGAAKYPDSKPMGYPFDRPFEKSFEETFKGVNNAFTRDVTIKWVDDSE